MGPAPSVYRATIGGGDGERLGALTGDPPRCSMLSPCAQKGAGDAIRDMQDGADCHAH
jgi:hypothetical protein